jgi:hypothetical protein
MSDYIKQIPLKEVKELYFENHGFVINSKFPVRESGIINLVNSIKNAGISKDFPILVTQDGDNTIFVYGEFNGPQFFQKADHFEMMGFAQIIPLLFFLKQLD